jgi:hypothetical protein
MIQAIYQQKENIWGIGRQKGSKWNEKDKLYDWKGSNEEKKT